MFKIDDYIMYGSVGVCKVIDIKEEKVMEDIAQRYYVLTPVYSRDTVIKIPVDNKKIVMRKIHSKDEISLIMNSMPDAEVLWIDDDRERNGKFKSMIKTGECENLITVVKSIHSNKEDKLLEGKKISKADEEIMKLAENLLNEEFSVILGIKPEEVTEYILNNATK